MELIANDSDSELDVETDIPGDSEEATNLSDIMTEAAQESKGESESTIAEHDDDDFKAEWIDTMHVPLVHMKLPYFPIRHGVHGPLHRWKGIDWSIFIVLKEREVGLYFGYNNPRQLAPGASMNLRFQFQLLDFDDNVVCEDQSTTFLFIGDPLANERVDRGHTPAVPLDVFKRYCFNMANAAAQRDPSAASVHAGFAPVRARLLVEEVFRPATTPLNYNSKLATGMVGLENLGATCYLNALLQMLFHINSFRRAVYSLPHADEHIATSTTLALQSVFRNLQHSGREVTTKELTVAFGWTSAEAFLQQDVQEMMRVLVDKLEEKMKDTVMDGFIKKLFAGTVRSYIRCVNVKYESKRQEEFYDIQLDVKGCKDIYESFRKYTTVEMLDGENQYEAGEFGKQDAQKGVIFESFPPVLTIHLKRFDFDLQSMGFTKIHDYFQFPLRLEVDEFLAPDCSEEARQVPNVYVLHSVLVHQGDVGGGHYYAYIRPTTKGFRYGGPLPVEAIDGGDAAPDEDNSTAVGLDAPLETLLASADAMLKVRTASAAAANKDQQWFKFNDEIVLPVTQREAVDYCYGRRIKETEFYRSMSSAYMLVYIRESEAADIMREVTVADIPPQLDARLDAELKQRLAVEKRAERMKYYQVAHFATDENVTAFKEYSRTQDLFNERSFTKLTVMKETSRLWIAIYIAQHLGCMPFDFRLWEVEKMDNFTYRVTDDVTAENLQQRMKVNRFYVESVTVKLDPEDKFLFEARFHELLADEKSFLERLAADLRGCPELYYADDEDPVLGCGIGSPNRPLVQLKALLPEKFEKYVREMKELNEGMGELVGNNYQDFPYKEELLVFVKLYDPYDLLPTRTQESSDSLESLSSDDEDGDDGAAADTTEDGSDEAASSLARAMDEEGANGALAGLTGRKRGKPSKSAASREYLPMKSVSAIVMSGSQRVSEVASVAFEKFADGMSDEWLDSFQQFQYYMSLGPLYVTKIPIKEVQAGVTLSQLLTEDQETGALVLYIDILPVQPAVLRVPYELTSARGWLNYVANKKTLLIRPYDQHDVDVLVRRQRIRQEAMMCQALEEAAAHPSGALSPVGTPISPAQASMLASPNKNKRVRPEFLRERAGSVGSQRDRSASMGSDFLGSSPYRVTPAKNQKARLGKSFTIEVSLTFKVAYLFRRLADELGVEPSHLALYFVPMGLRDWEDRRGTTLPMNYLQSPQLIMECLKNLRISNKANTKYCVFYRILPFGLLTEDVHDRRVSHKLSDFLITDARIRNWRRNYLEYLKSQPTVAVRSGTGTPRLGALPAALESGAARSRANSEAIAPRSRANSEAGASGVRVVWPRPSATEYDPLEENYVSLCLPRKAQLGDFAGALRDIMGIPLNVDAMEAMKQHADPADSNATIATNALRETPGLAESLCTRGLGVCSDRLGVDAHGAVQPAFPLLVYNIRELCEVDILTSDRAAHEFVNCVSEVEGVRDLLYIVGVQHVSAEDMLFLRNYHTSIRSIPVVVINFTLNGKFADPCDPTDIPGVGGPLVSYVREDDDYQAILRRFTAMTGDKEDAHKLRLAVIESKLPYFVPRPRSTLPLALSVPSIAALASDPLQQATQPMDGVDAEVPLVRTESLPRAPGQDTSSVGAAVPSAVWTLLLEKYPHVLTWSDIPSKAFPIIGIQRSAADVAPKARTMRSGGSIKIV